MKKGILVAGASVLLLSGLVAGVFAKYQTTLDEVGTGSVTAKNFVFLGEGTNEGTGTIKLAPGEKAKLAVIKVMNFNDTITSEVAIDVKRSLSVTGDLADGIAALTSNDELKFTFEESGVVSSIDSFQLEAGTKVTKTFDLYAEWIDTIGTTQDDSEQNALVGKSSTWSVKFVGTQH